jgi:hypothetical protein
VFVSEEGKFFHTPDLLSRSARHPGRRVVAGRPLSVLSGLARRASGIPAAESHRGQTVTDSHTPGLPATSARNEHGIRAALLERYPDMGVDNHDWDTPPRTVYGAPTRCERRASTTWRSAGPGGIAATRRRAVRYRRGDRPARLVRNRIADPRPSAFGPLPLSCGEQNCGAAGDRPPRTRLPVDTTG